MTIYSNVHEAENCYFPMTTASYHNILYTVLYVCNDYTNETNPENFFYFLYSKHKHNTLCALKTKGCLTHR